MCEELGMVSDGSWVECLSASFGDLTMRTFGCRDDCWTGTVTKVSVIVTAEPSEIGSQQNHAAPTARPSESEEDPAKEVGPVTDGVDGAAAICGSVKPSRRDCLVKLHLVSCVFQLHVETIMLPDSRSLTRGVEQAAEEDDWKMCQKVLQDDSALVDVRDPAGRTALHNAAIRGSVYAAHVLILHGADISATTLEKKTALLLAV